MTSFPGRWGGSPWIALTMAVGIAIAAAPLSQAQAPAEASSTQTGPPASTPLQGATRLNAEGSRFLASAAEDNALQLDAARLAAEKATSPEVKAFAQATLQSRSRVQDSLVQLAQRRGASLPGGPDKAGQRLLEKLRHQRGAEFERTYSQAMLQAHRAAVRSFEQATQSDAQDGEVKTFAAAELPLLRDHLRMAQTLPGAHQG